MQKTKYLFFHSSKKYMKYEKKNNISRIGKVRIIGGKWKNQKLLVLNKPGLRPITDRAKETLFNWISPFIIGASCLDCFAGSGSLGIEALSRYAASATLLEIENSIAKQLQQTLTKLKILNAKVINTNALHYLSQLGIPQDIVFIDPPFQKKLLQVTLNLLEKNGWLKSTSFLYIKSEAKNILNIPYHWVLYREITTLYVSHRLYHL